MSPIAKLLLLAAGLQVSVIAHASAITIADQKASTWRIALAPDSDPAVQFAAQELVKYCEQMIGVRLPIVASASGDDCILLGLRKDLSGEKDLLAAKAGFDGYSLRIAEHRIVIAGDNPRGVVYGAYDLLERMGCRWCYPEQDSKDPPVVPRINVLKLEPASVSVASPLAVRICNGDAWFFEMNMDAAGKQLDWAMKNRYNAMGWQSESKHTLVEQYEGLGKAGLLDALHRRGMMLHGPAHSFDHFLRADDHMKDHPEWFGLRDGKRVPQTFVGAQFCWSNAEARAQFIENVIKFVQACPRLDMLCLVPFDGGIACACEGCNKAGASNLLMQLFHELIDRVHQVRPGMPVDAVGSYGPVEDPPTGGALHPRQGVVWAHWGRYYDRGCGDPGYGRLDNLEKWRKAATGGLTLCEYMTDNFAEPWVLPPFTTSMIGDRQYFIEKKIHGVYMLMWSPGYWWNHSLNGYLAGRCFYDPALDPWADLKDYAMHYFGPKAGPLLGEYYTAWARNVDLAYRVRGDAREGERSTLADQRRRLIDPALQAVADDAVLAYRVGKVEKLHGLAEAAVDFHLLRRQLGEHCQAGRVELAQQSLEALSARRDTLLAHFQRLADLDQGLMDANEVKGFIKLAFDNAVNEETKQVAEVVREAKLAATSEVFVNPICEGADPWVTRHENYYYFCQSEGNMGIAVYKSAKLSELGTKRIVWRPQRGQWNSKLVWAPELHYLRGKWYIYYAASRNVNEDHLAGVLEARTDDPQGEYIEHGPLYTGDEFATQTNNRWAIDATPLEWNNQLYLIWSGWPALEDVQYLYIAPMSDPTRISGNRVKICDNADYLWERVSEKASERGLSEAPQVLRHGGKTMLTYSCSGSWQPSYKLGLLSIDAGSDPLNPASWRKLDRPIFTGGEGVIGVGHASFTTSPDNSQHWIVYHTKRNSGDNWQRAVHIQPFTWTLMGLPDFGPAMAAGRALAVPSGEAGPVPGDTFTDNFASAHFDDWVYYGYHRYITVREETLSVGGEPRWGVVNQYRSGEKALVRGKEWSDVDLQARVQVIKGDKDAGLLFRVRRPSIGYDAQQGYFAGLIPTTDKVVLGKTDGKTWQELALVDHPLENGQWYLLRVEARGPEIRVYVDSDLKINVQDSTCRQGQVGVRVVDTQALFDDFKAVAVP